MWRLWTRGWGPRSWWVWFCEYGFPMFVAWRIPRKIALWVFIRVYVSAHENGGGPEYRQAYNAWAAGKGR